MAKKANRRRFIATVGAVTLAGSLAGCSFSYSSSDDRLSMSETVGFDAEEGEEILVEIRSGGDSSDDSSISESGRAELYGPSGQLLVELSFSDREGSGLRSDEETLTAPTSGTYELENGDRTVTATIEVDGETVL